MAEKERDMLAERLLEVARKDHAEWVAAFQREERRGEEARAEACLSGANAVEQCIKRMERALRASSPQEGNENE